VLSQYFASLDAQATRTVFQLTLLSLVVAAGGIIWFFRVGSKDVVGFQLRESDRPRARRSPRLPTVSAYVGADGRLGAQGSAQKPKNAKPLLLNGIRLDGAPHEILGVKEKATRAEIQKAYRDLMKRYHPDMVGRPGSREWKDAQRIAEAVGKARDELLKRAVA
jgi:hypothetical protein